MAMLLECLPYALTCITVSEKCDVSDLNPDISQHR
jgi:hypothetical protein